MFLTNIAAKVLIAGFANHLYSDPSTIYPKTEKGTALVSFGTDQVTETDQEADGSQSHCSSMAAV